MIEETYEINATKICVIRPDDSNSFSYGELEDLVKRCNTEPNAYLRSIVVKVDEEGYMDLEKHYEPYPFERIRRITGYCSPTTKWNNAKKAELKDRTKHGLTSDDGYGGSDDDGSEDWCKNGW